MRVLKTRSAEFVENELRSTQGELRHGPVEGRQVQVHVSEVAVHVIFHEGMRPREVRVAGPLTDSVEGATDDVAASQHEKE